MFCVKANSKKKKYVKFTDKKQGLSGRIDDRQKSSAKAAAMTAADIITEPELLMKIKEEFKNSDPTPFELPQGE